MIELFPLSARLEDGELRLGDVPASELTERFGSPLVVYCEETLRAQARTFSDAGANALILYGTKAFPNVAVMKLFATEGLGADVASLGELAFALAAGIPGERIVVHGNNKSDEELEAAVSSEATVALDSEDELDRALAVGASRLLVRVTPGIETDTHAAIRTGHAGSKFGLSPEAAGRVVAAAPEAIVGLHVHLGSQLGDATPQLEAIDKLASLAGALRDEHGWTPHVLDLGGGFGIRHVLEEPEVDVGAAVGALVERMRTRWEHESLPPARLLLEPGRALVGRAGVTLYRVGATKMADGVRWVAVDGGISDNPRPLLYGARYTALLANRAEEPSGGTFRIAGKHCESGDVLIEAVDLPEPRRGDVVAVPATGAYTLAMSSNYNGVPRPAVVLVSRGDATLIRRRESVENLLALEP